MARYPQNLEEPLSVEPRDSCLHQPYAFVRCMRVANGVNERLAVAYELGIAPAFVELLLDSTLSSLIEFCLND